MLRAHGTSTLAEFLDDRVLYRSLQPVDPGLPGFRELRPLLGMPDGRLPRKIEPEYARVVAELLRRALRLSGSDERPRGLLMIGDTAHSDGQAFLNLVGVLDCPAAAFIGEERAGPPLLELARDDRGRTVYTSNRWQLLEEFAGRALAGGLTVGPGTVVIIDIDKTALGARGRNHRPIDAARIAAARTTVARLVGGRFDDRLFDAVYEHLNQSRFHPFTSDNQDVVAYLCLVVAAGLYDQATLAERIASGDLASFQGLLDEVTERRAGLPAAFAAVHRAVADAVAAGDPTPFKEFRRAEFEETVARMGRDAGTSELGRRLEQELTITHEVRECALAWRACGALLLGLSDKPDEASLPTPEQAARGLLPLHRTPALVVGEEP